MHSATWLRAAAGLTAFLAIGHTFGAVLAPPANAEESAMREAMRALRLTLMGIERSYWDFHYGSALAITAMAAALAGIMWYLSPMSRQSPGAARPIILVLAAGFAALTAISARHFVTAPIIVSAMITVCLGAAALASRHE